MNKSTKNFIISNSFFALSEVLKKVSDNQKDETSQSILFASSVALKIGMNIFIVKGVFAKLEEMRNQNNNHELIDLVIDNQQPNTMISQPTAIQIVNNNQITR